MKYQQEGEDEVDLKTEFSVTSEDDGIVLELHGGSNIGEYYSLSVDEARHLALAITDTLKRKGKETRHAVGL